MSITQTRLDTYVAAEARILARGAGMRFGERQKQEAELETIRKAIAQLQQQLARETAAAAGHGSLRAKTVVFS